MKLHWSPRSPFVRKVMVAAHELGVSDRIEIMPTPVAMGQPNADLLADNPLSKIPTLILADGTALYDSLTICKYLNDFASGRLFPGGAGRWDVLTGHALGTGFLDLLVLWRNERDKPAGQQSSEWLDSFAAKTAATLRRVEGMTAGLEAVSVDIRHITFACALSYLDLRFSELDWRAGRPALAGWHAGFAGRESMVATEPAPA